MSVNIFERATRERFRFNSPKGPLSVEELWELPLTSKTGQANLDDIAIGLNSEIEKGTKVSFVKKGNVADQNLELARRKLDIVTAIIEVKLSEADKAKRAKTIRERNQRIMELIAKKDAEIDEGKSREELLAMLQNPEDFLDEEG